MAGSRYFEPSCWKGSQSPLTPIASRWVAPHVAWMLRPELAPKAPDTLPTSCALVFSVSDLLTTERGPRLVTTPSTVSDPKRPRNPLASIWVVSDELDAKVRV